MNRITRRKFLGGLAGASVFALVPRHVVAKSKVLPPSERLNIAGIGAGGRAFDVLRILGLQQNIVALCDVDEVQGAKGFNKWPDATRYKDFRVMLEKEKGIDAVVVATPNHVHAVAAMTAMELGKHVYVEKPMAHTVSEVRQLMAAARQYNVATQMGNQGHGSTSCRLVEEAVAKEIIGEIREVQCWTMYGSTAHGKSRPAETPPIPATLDWDLWLGPAPKRPYHSCYLPNNWRGWWDFGEGPLGDMGCHAMDGAFSALNLPPPSRISAETSGCTDETVPASSIVRYEFPQRVRKPPVALTWYDSGNLPPRPEELEPERRMGGENGGTIFIGTKGKIMTDAYSGSMQIFPKERMEEFKARRKKRSSALGHFAEWVEACKGGKPAGSNFDYAGPLTEMVLLGLIAIRAGQPVEWDAKEMKVTNLPDAQRWVIGNPYRDGWKMPATSAR